MELRDSSFDITEMKQKKVLEEGKDRISDLPEDVVFRIFSLLPIKTVAQMSILSKRWRYLWHSFPYLDFSSVDDFRKPQSEYLNQILCLIQKKKHSWDLRVLKIQTLLCSFSEMECLIQHVINKHDIQVLHLEVKVLEEFDIPCFVFQSQSLVSLCLASHKYFRLPPLEMMVQGFRSLTELYLQQARFEDQHQVNNLFTDDLFPSLRTLHVLHCIGFKMMRIQCSGLRDLHIGGLTGLEIIAPKLEKLRFSDCHEYRNRFHVTISAPALRILEWWRSDVPSQVVMMNKCSHLQKVSLHVFFILDFRDDDPNNLSDFLINISHCHSLKIDSSWVSMMYRPEYKDTFSVCTFDILKFLELSVGGFRGDDSRILLSIIRCCPGIHTLSIKADGYHLGPDNDWESVRETEPFLVNLMVLKVHGITICDYDYVFIEFMLNHAKKLKEIHVCYKNLDRRGRDWIMSVASSKFITVVFDPWTHPRFE